LLVGIVVEQLRREERVLEVAQGVLVPEIVAAGSDVAYRGQGFVEVVPPDAARQAMTHGALFGVHHELGGRAMKTGLVPAGRVPDVVGAGREDRHQGRGAFVSGLGVEGLGPAQGTGRSPWNAITASELSHHGVDHEISGVPAIGAPDFIDTVDR
jgi:hypothetical protein